MILRHAAETVRRAFVEFLTVPAVAIGGFVLLAVVTWFLDRGRGEGPIVGLLDGILFGDRASVVNLLGVIAAGIITLTSITFSLLLIAVQQGAAALTSQVFDQFLRRRANQLYFGFFVGLALYALIVLATVSPTHTPVYGVALAFLMTAATFVMLILLIYTTVDQMRPVMIVQAIREHTLAARERQRALLRATRRTPRLEAPARARVTASQSGFLARIDVAALAAAAAAAPGEVEIVILPSVGDFVGFRDPVAEIRMTAPDAGPLERAAQAALVFEEQRDLGSDPGFGIEQLRMIGWTSISTAKSNPEPGLLVCWSFRDILARWIEPREDEDDAAPAPVVYRDDVPGQVIAAFESLMVVASESMQHQSLAEILRSIAALFQRLPAPLRRQAEDVLMRSLSALGEHVPTRDLDDALVDVADALAKAGRPDAAAAIGEARRLLARSIGQLNARSTRAARS